MCYKMGLLREISIQASWPVLMSRPGVCTEEMSTAISTVDLAFLAAPKTPCRPLGQALPIGRQQVQYY